MLDFDQIANRYIDTWNMTDTEDRAGALRQHWADEATYVDPLVEARGHAEIDATISAVQAQFPTFTFRLTGAAEGHHNQCRFQWELGPVGEPAPVAGSDVVVLTDEGRVKSVFGFLDRVPTA